VKVYIQRTYISIFLLRRDMSFSYSYRNLFIVVLMIMLAFLVVSPHFGAACRPLLKDELLLKLQKGTPVVSSPDPTHTWNKQSCMLHASSMHSSYKLLYVDSYCNWFSFCLGLITRTKIMIYIYGVWTFFSPNKHLLISLVYL